MIKSCLGKELRSYDGRRKERRPSFLTLMSVTLRREGLFPWTAARPVMFDRQPLSPKTQLPALGADGHPQIQGEPPGDNASLHGFNLKHFHSLGDCAKRAFKEKNSI